MNLSLLCVGGGVGDGKASDKDHTHKAGEELVFPSSAVGLS